MNEEPIHECVIRYQRDNSVDPSASRSWGRKYASFSGLPIMSAKELPLDDLPKRSLTQLEVGSSLQRAPLRRILKWCCDSASVLDQGLPV